MQTEDKSRHYGEPGHGHHARGLLWMTLAGIAFLANSYIAQRLFPENLPAADLSAALAALVLFIPILKTAISDLVGGEMHMNELVALAILASMAQGDFRTASVVALIMLVSLVIETRTAEGAHASIEGLIRLTPARARLLLEDGTTQEVEVSQLKIGDRVRALPGDTIPADGIIVSGRTSLNEASITGESLPRDKGVDDEVFAGTQNLTGAVEIRVKRVGGDTTIGRVRDLILAAEQTKLPIMRIIDRYVGYYTPTVLMIGGLVWFFTDDMTRVIALLVVACPCALILATPTAMVAALSASARLGILVKDVSDLEGAAKLTAFVLDKTGTLTTGQLGVVRLAPRPGIQPSELLEAAAGAERFSKHPAALALAALAKKANVALADPQDFHEEPGQGIRATVKGETVLAGRATWLQQNRVPDAEIDPADLSEAEGYSVIHVARGGRHLGWIGFQDEVRPEARACVQELEQLDIRRMVMVTGDRQPVAARVAEQIGCREFKAECLPQGKVDLLKSLRSDGYRVAFVGDGVNDAPAIAASDTGIAMGAAGSEIAIHSATVALMNNDLRKLPFLVRLSRGTRAVIYQNLAIGALFIGGGLVLSGLGWLRPIVAALLHNAGALLVVFNSARLIRAGEEF